MDISAILFVVMLELQACRQKLWYDTKLTSAIECLACLWKLNIKIDTPRSKHRELSRYFAFDMPFCAGCTE